MDRQLTIQQVAELTGLTVHTLRYYERIGLLHPVSRAASGHRRYSQRDVDVVRFLGRLRATGMPIRQMQRYAALLREGPTTVAARRELLEEHGREVRARLDELGGHLAAVEAKIALYRALEADAEPGTAAANPAALVGAARGRGV